MKITNKTELPVGKYWVGDLCYVVGDEGPDFSWNEFCDVVFNDDVNGRKATGQIFEHNGMLFAFHFTKYGDGRYYDQHGNYYSVDAGLIGIIPYDFVSPHITDEELNRLGQIHSFEMAFETSFEDDREQGEIVYGPLRIQTGDSYDEDEEDW